MHSLMQNKGAARTTFAVLLCGFLLQIAGCASNSESCTYWRPTEENESIYSNQDGIACFIFKHPSGIRFTLYVTHPGDGKEFQFFGEFMIPSGATLKLAEREFEVSNTGKSAITVKIGNLVILDEVLNRTVAIPADTLVVGATKLALIEERRHKYCSFTSDSFQNLNETMSVKIPTISVNGVNWVFPRLHLEKYTGRVSRSFSP